MRGTVFGETEEGSWIVRMRTALADAGAHADTDAVTPTDVQQAFQGETMEIREKGVCMGLWQLAAGASLLQVPIVSVYPEKGWATYQLLYSRTLSPLNGRDDALKAHIMWSSNRPDEMDEDNWVANHVVPLLPLSPTVDSVSSFRVYNKFTTADVNINAFFIITWNGDDYTSRIDHICSENVMLNIMERVKDLFCFSTQPDTSLEDGSVLKQRVQLDLVPECSTHRKLFNRLV